MGASDQWGNITAGIDLIRRVHGAKAHCLVFPLLTTSSGVKFGKSTGGGSVWLDSERTSPYSFYQYFFNTEDADVVKYLKFFTLLPKEEVDSLEEAIKTHPEKREAQKKLAQEVTRMVHGDNGLRSAEQASQVLFGGEIGNISLADVKEIFAEAPSVEISKADFTNEMTLADLAVTSGIARSKGEARRLIEGGGVYLQNVRINDPRHAVSLNDALEGRAFVLRKGQKDYRLVLVS
jgi:tyrosyl-tRNA synthetase